MGEHQVVVAAAVVDGGRLLAARRVAPAELAGRFELPGGKVEPGEDDRAALLREIREELGVDVVLGSQLGGDWPLGPGRVLRVWMATLADPADQPRPLTDHDRLVWVDPQDAADLGWLPADVPPVSALVERLRSAR